MSLPSALRNRLMLIISALMLAMLAGIGLSQYQQAQHHAEQEALKHGEMLLRQTSLLATPLLQANDRVSLNYLLNELISLPYIEAAQLTTTREGIIARAGNTGGIEMQQALTNRQNSYLSIWLNPTSFAVPLQQQIITSSMASLITLALCLLAVHRVLTHNTGSLTGSSATTVTHSILHAEIASDSTSPQITTGPSSGQAIHLYNEVEEISSITNEDGSTAVPSTSSSLPEPAISDTTAKTKTHLQAIQKITSATPTTSPPLKDTDIQPVPAQKDELKDFISSITQEQSTYEHKPDEDSSTGQNAPAKEQVQVISTEPDNPSQNTLSQQLLDTEDLVSLLRPEPGTTVAQTFSPSNKSQHTDVISEETGSQAHTAQDTTAISEAPLPTTAAASSTANPSGQIRRPNPLLSGQSPPPPSSYLAEHEEELIPAATDAGYCFYVDTSAHSGNSDADERTQLLMTYKRLAAQSAALYKGHLIEMKTGDFFIHFSAPLPDDSHGINATCSAMLFNLLYKAFNQQRIRSFKPALNLRMSLARGRKEHEQRLLEEARALAHTTESNDLITHTALTEAQSLQQKLLQYSKLRRDEEDKVIITTLPENVQTLLQKQAEQLLSRLEANE
ncbi:MAG: hypothetical protein OIF57_10785 [Marinobacterium sp.]|nr:hypothetical protein [Marinobacterium sp.]